LSIARRRILVVSDTLALANNLLTWLKDAGYEPAVVTTFSAGKERLRTAPDILITELKLREYNGLHLALRAHRDGIPAAVIGHDRAFASDAQEVGASYVADDNVHRDDILLLIDGLLSARAAQAGPLTWTVGGAESAAAAAPAAEDDWQIQAADQHRDAVGSSQGRLVIH
jgi:DNA-binding NtrC family response regulator